MSAFTSSPAFSSSPTAQHLLFSSRYVRAKRGAAVFCNQAARQFHRMKSLFHFPSHLSDFGQLLRWTLLALPVAVTVGSATALFLWALDKAIHLQWEHPELLWGLPLAGVAVGLLYHYLGKGSDRGNNLLIDEIHQPGGGVPARMAPLVLVGTVITHLFGGSAGREGTAVQMGGSLAGLLARWFRVTPANRRLMLMSGIAAGFGAVFGTPLTGAIFAMEVLVIGRVQYDALIPVLVASVIGDATCTAWGIHHTVYHLDVAPGAGTHAAFDALLLLKVALSGICFGLAGRLFSELTYSLQGAFKKLVPYAPLRPAVGGVMVIAMVFLLGTRDYLGLGVVAPPGGTVSILASFGTDGATPWSWLWKTVFTSVTISSGFKGGEVTPLFFIGSTMGHVLGILLHEPVALFAALGFVAVFAGAANTPLACTIMGIELFGAHYGVSFGIACFVSYFFAGHTGIYLSQRLGVPKKHSPLVPPDATLREALETDALLAPAPWDWRSRTVEVQLQDLPDPPSVSNPTANERNIPAMPHEISTQEMGKIRIYVTPREKTAAEGLWQKLNAKPLYRTLINAAKKDGLRNAAAFMTHYGFSNHGAVQAYGVEAPNPDLTLCVEIIDQKNKLEAFCREHGDLLKGKIIVYKHVEQWDVKPGELVETDVSPNEIIDVPKVQPVPES